MSNKYFVFILILFFLPFLNADIMSINSGGSTGLVITPDKYIEGFFMGGICGDGSCNSAAGENCATCVADCACGAGFTCSFGTCIAVPVTPGGGGGGGGGGGALEECDIVAVPNFIDLDLKVEGVKREIIKLTNTGGTLVNIVPTQVSWLNDIIITFSLNGSLLKPGVSFSLGPGETKDLEVIFVALNETGTFTGKINLGCEEVFGNLDVKTLLLLFDSNIVVLNKDYKVGRGDKLLTKVTLIPMGDPERLDVTLNYKIQDYAGKIYMTQSESVLVSKKIDFKRNFETGKLPLGQYIVGLELIYPGGVAPSSAHFEIVEKTMGGVFARIIFYLVILILLVAMFIIILLIKRRRDKEKQQQGM